MADEMIESASVPDEIRNCMQCGKQSAGLHPCPCASAVNNNNDPDHCNCCDDCARECRMDI